MRILYIISAYQLPEQLIRLVHRLNTSAASFFVHVDKKSSDAVYLSMVNGLRGVPNVHFLKRHSCWWGGFGHVAATLEGIEKIFDTGDSFDYVILLTGQDYPIKTNADIEDFLRRHKDTPFMEYFPLPSKCWANGGLDRIQFWHFRVFDRYVRVPANRHFLPKRRFPRGLGAFGGSSYWCLPRECVEYIYGFTKSNRAYVRFFKHVDVPDEMFFQTIIMNSPFAPRVVNDDLRYIDWSDPKSGSPAILRADDFARISQSTKLFARKFDVTQDGAILDMIDERILSSGYPGQ